MGLHLGASGMVPYRAAGVTAARLCHCLVAKKCLTDVVLGKSWQGKVADDRTDILYHFVSVTYMRNTPLSWTKLINTYWTNEIKSAEFIAMHTPLYQLKYMTNVSKCCDCADYCRLTEFGPGLTEFGPPMWQAEADNELTLVWFACHSSGPKSVNHGEILLVYGIPTSKLCVKSFKS